jgi:hypothetical protein
MLRAPKSAWPFCAGLISLAPVAFPIDPPRVWTFPMNGATIDGS